MINFSYLYAQQELLEPPHTQGLTIPCDQISEDMLRAKALLHGLSSVVSQWGYNVYPRLCVHMSYPGLKTGSLQRLLPVRTTHRQ